MKSNYTGTLKPQKSEGILSVGWKKIKEAKEIKKKTFRNIAMILSTYLKEF